MPFILVFTVYPALEVPFVSVGAMRFRMGRRGGISYLYSGKGEGPAWLGYQGIARFSARLRNTTNVVETKD